MRAGPERRRPVAQGDHDRDRRQPAAARHRLRRPLPDPPLGPDDADRGDARGAARRGQGRQGALHRRVVDVRLAVRQGAATSPTRTAGPASSRCRTTTTCSTARRSARCCRSAPTRAIGVIPWSPLARGRLTRRLGRRRPTGPETDEFGKTLYARRGADRPVVERVAEVAERARRLPRAGGAGLGGGATRWSPRRSSARPSRTTSTTPSPRSTWCSPTTRSPLEEPYVPHPVAGF